MTYRPDTVEAHAPPRQIATTNWPAETMAVIKDDYSTAGARALYYAQKLAHLIRKQEAAKRRQAGSL